MALPTVQQIDRYYEKFRDVDVIFTKEVIATLRLLPKQIYLKQQGNQIPCVIYSTSMSGAKVVVNVKSELFLRMRATKRPISLRFSLLEPGKPSPLSFFVACKIAGYAPYGTDSRELNFVSLVYPQRPSDDLIALLGVLLEANVNSKKRGEERIVVTADNLAKIGLTSKDAVVYIQNVARRCIVRDLSFSGSRLIVPGFGKFLLDKPAVLQLELEDSPEPLELTGTIVRIEAIGDREDIAAIALRFDEEHVPLAYKMRISEYLSLNVPKPGVATEA